MLHVGKRCVKDVYTKVIVKSWTTSVTTGKVRSETYQLVWLVATQTVSVSHLDINLLGLAWDHFYRYIP